MRGVDQMLGGVNPIGRFEELAGHGLLLLAGVGHARLLLAGVGCCWPL